MNRKWMYVVHFIHSRDKTNLSSSFTLPPFTWNNLRYSRVVFDSNTLFFCLDAEYQVFFFIWGGRKGSLGSEGGGLHAEIVQPTLTVILKLVIGYLTRILLIVLGENSSSSVPRWVCCHFSELSSQNCGSLYHGCSLVFRLLPPGGGFSIYKTAHRTWLRILSVALKKELKVLDFA